MIRTRTTELEAIVADRIRRSVQAAVLVTIDLFLDDGAKLAPVTAPWIRT